MPRDTTDLVVGVGGWLPADAAARLRSRARESGGVRVVPVGEPVDPAAGHLIVDGDGRPDDGLVDARLPGVATVDVELVDRLWDRRVVPFARNLARGRRAPRARTAIVAPYDPAWPGAARRIDRRLRVALGPRARRVEHVGSTAVPGMSGKDLVDVLVVVDDLAGVDALGVADWHRAGVVPVAGAFYGIDRHDREHPQRVAVDADPGRPVNVHLHPEHSPVWRELVAFRDWLRADRAHRDEYADLKHRLVAEVSGDVDAYSRAKRAWINEAVARALRAGGVTG